MARYIYLFGRQSRSRIGWGVAGWAGCSTGIYCCAGQWESSCCSCFPRAGLAWWTARSIFGSDRHVFGGSLPFENGRSVCSSVCTFCHFCDVIFLVEEAGFNDACGIFLTTVPDVDVSSKFDVDLSSSSLQMVCLPFNLLYCFTTGLAVTKESLTTDLPVQFFQTCTNFSSSNGPLRFWLLLFFTLVFCCVSALFKFSVGADFHFIIFCLSFAFVRDEQVSDFLNS